MKIEKLQDLQSLDTISGVAGRSLNEQIKWVRKYGNFGIPSELRERTLQALGIPKPKPTARNLIVFGCYIPFAHGVWLRDYIKILDLIGVEYSYLQSEFCCGSPMIRSSTGIERRRAIKASKEFVQMNLDMAKEKGATTIVYCCMGCIDVSRSFFPDEAKRHVYLLDLIIEKLKQETLLINLPNTVGYFEGCHTIRRANFPGVSIDWAKYRRFLDRIKHLRIVDLPNNICCRKYPERIIAAAEEQRLSTLLCPCNGCYSRIGVASNGKVQVKHLAEVILQSLRRE